MMVMMVPAVIAAPVAAVAARVLTALVIVSAILVTVMSGSRAVTKGEQQRERACRGEAQ
jgi:hypothetical protein